jgi:hypothetical protein
MIRKVFLWELLTGGKPYIILLIFFLLLYVAMDYPPREGGGVQYYPSVTPDPFALETFNLHSAVDIGWYVGNIWWFLFPVIISLAVLLFSYDIDRGLLRTYMLSQTSRTSLFIGKLAAIFAAVYIPLLVGGALILVIADPTLFIANPLFVWDGLWLRLLGWMLMTYTMIGFSVFPALVLKKPLYAFITPYVVFYALSLISIPANIRAYIPPTSFLELQFITPGGPAWLIEADLRSFWKNAWPSIAVATIVLIISYILFVKMEQP